ncbi:hypothetical protein A4G19_09190 [Pasteurellaceae bacterium Macca]|nr:hypothetical protein [Pasteurellaceae bacterium Macca]
MQNVSFFRPLALLLFALLMSYLMLLGSGFFPHPTVQNVGLLALVLIWLNQSKLLFWGLLLPLVSLYALYAPIGLTFGPPSYQYAASVFATDLNEGKEFFQQIPFWHSMAGVGIFVGLFALQIFSKKRPLVAFQHPYFLGASALFIFICTPPFQFLQESYTATMQVKRELDKLNSLTIASEWGNSTLSPQSRYDDYVLVIGESARKDYHHAYGYPVENTPFMSSAKGTLIDGLTAGGTNTIASLKLMLTHPDAEKWEGNYHLTLIDLIKSAGIPTYWISNQGYLGTYDTPISSIANKSDEKIFLKAGDSLNQNISDFKLLPQFEQLISRPTKGKRFIVLHLYGSHPVTCDRLTDFPTIFAENDLPKKYHNVNCYVSSIKKTDKLLEQVYQTLKNNEQNQGRRFSLVYFADHGLAHQISEENIVIHNSSGKSKRHFDVPLFKISSDDNQRHEYHAFKSGLNFTNALANWVGIQNPRLNPQLDLFSFQADPDDYGLTQQIEKIDAPDDPAIPLPPLKK